MNLIIIIILSINLKMYTDRNRIVEQTYPGTYLCKFRLLCFNIGPDLPNEMENWNISATTR